MGEGRETGDTDGTSREESTDADAFGSAARRGLARVRRRLVRLSDRLASRSGPRRWVEAAIQLGVVALGMAMGAHLHTGAGVLVDLALGAGVAVLVMWLLGALLRLSGGVARGMVRFLGSLGTAGFLALVLILWPLGGLPVGGALVLAALATIGFAFLGVGAGSLGSGGRRVAAEPAGDPRAVPSRATVWAITATGLLLVGSLVVIVLYPGSAGHLFPPPEIPEALSHLALSDPGEPGPREVEAWTYGSGTDRWRPEFGEDGVRFTSTTVDGSVLLDAWSGWRGSLRTAWWGFGSEALPLNARVWSPDGEGPHPLVLVVHGNHLMSRFSDPGYAYLGRHLASWGYIVASVDQNFLNAAWFGDLGEENDARAWLLLEHLALWRRWAEGGEHEVARRADLDRVVLIGHSRGGEAAAVAAAFSRLAHYPEDASLAFEYGFGIRGVVAFAPVDGQYRPAGQRTPLRDVSYLVIHGGHDADVSSFVGDRQYERVEFSSDADAFKSAFYVHEANHGQFNTEWGSRDRFPPWGWLLNRAPLLSGDEQRGVAVVAVTAFLEATTRERAGYRAFFQDPRLGRNWLPAANYLVRYREPGFILVAGYQEDVDLTTGTLPGTRLEADGLSLWREQDVGFRGDGLRERQAVALGWRWRPPARNDQVEEDERDDPDADGEEEDPGPPEYRIRLPEPFFQGEGLDAGGTLVFSAATLARAPSGGDERRTLRSPPEPITFSVELEDWTGRRASVSLADEGPLHPPLEARFTKVGFLERSFQSPTEPVFQDVALPLRRFLEQEPALVLSSLRTITFRFDGSPEGVVLVDGVGFNPHGRVPVRASSSNSVRPGPRWASNSSR